jgi:hypothetical protein
MFAIVSGLGHSSVSRLKLTWDKLGNKYNRIFKVFMSQRQRTGAEAALRCRLLPSPLSSCVRAPQKCQNEHCQSLPMFANIVRKVCRFSRTSREKFADIREKFAKLAQLVPIFAQSCFANYQCQFSHNLTFQIISANFRTILLCKLSVPIFAQSYFANYQCQFSHNLTFQIISANFRTILLCKLSVPIFAQSYFANYQCQFPHNLTLQIISANLRTKFSNFCPEIL